MSHRPEGGTQKIFAGPSIIIAFRVILTAGMGKRVRFEDRMNGDFIQKKPDPECSGAQTRPKIYDLTDP